MLKLLFKPAVFISLLITVVACTTEPEKKEYRENIELNKIQTSNTPFSNFLGVNGFEWDFFEDGKSVVDTEKVKNMLSFGGFRHYMDWGKIELEKGKYTFNPTRAGGFNYDMVYQLCSQNNVEVLTCMQNCPPWLVDTYPGDQQDVDNVPAPFGLNHSDPASYILQAKAAFQFTARYGNNKAIDTTLIALDKTPRWNGDIPNTLKVGLGYVHYIECNNEVDKTWKGAKAHQSPEEYAANLSAFYDGDMGKLGKGVGVKTADSTMKVVMSGIAYPDTSYVIRMIQWCKKHRGYKANGAVNLCFDVINYHTYNNDGPPGTDKYSIGKPPELTAAAKVADDFVAMSAKYANGMDVWITESGYDINAQSRQRTISINYRSPLLTQADWILRSAFLYARHGLKRSFFYMLDDVDKNSGTSYSSSGFVEGNKKRPVANYFLEVKSILGNYSYQQTISSDPMVDVYVNQDKKIYVMYVPDEKDRKAFYDLELKGATSAKIYRLVPGAPQVKTDIVPVKNGELEIDLTETPIFVEANN